MLANTHFSCCARRRRMFALRAGTTNGPTTRWVVPTSTPRSHTSKTLPGREAKPCMTTRLESDNRSLVQGPVASQRRDTDQACCGGGSLHNQSKDGALDGDCLHPSVHRISKM